MKTCSQVFTTGLTIQDKKPARGEKFLSYEGKYYVLSENRIPYQRDKTQDDRFFILTLFAIVKELEENPLIQPEDVIQVDLPIGLPPKHYAELCERYESYFKRQRCVLLGYPQNTKENGRKEIMNFKELLYRARQGDEDAILEIFEMYRPLLIKNALVDGIFDEDLYQELTAELLKCIRYFRDVE